MQQNYFISESLSRQALTMMKAEMQSRLIQFENDYRFHNEQSLMFARMATKSMENITTMKEDIKLLEEARRNKNS